MTARHLRQHEDGGRSDLRRQGAPIQSSLSADVLAPSDRTSGLHARLGMEKGQVENQVGNLRDQMFRPKPRVKSLAELNAWLEDQCIAYAKRTRHPEFKDRTIWEVFEAERTSLMQLRGPFDGFVEKAVRASTTCLIMADHNRYSVDARAAGRMVLVRSHAERIVVLLDDAEVAEHVRQLRRNQIVYDPWHYLPVLMRKPGALRNGAPFKAWDLPPNLAQVRAKVA